MLAKEIAAELIVKRLTSSANSFSQSNYKDFTPLNLVSVPSNSQQSAQIREIILNFIDNNQSLTGRLNLYAEKVDYYKAGVVSRNYIRKDMLRYMKKFPSRFYRLKGIKKIDLDSSGGLAAVLYTIEFEVSNEKKIITGIADNAILIGNLDYQPKIYGIKEWVTNRNYDYIDP